METAIVSAANQGLRFSVAAGNAGADASDFSPARRGQHSWIWTAEVSDGEPPYTNIIWFRNDEGDPPFWQQVATGPSYSTTVTSSFELKARVTDDANTTVTAAGFSIATN